MKPEIPPLQPAIEHRIFTIRGVQVMLDRDLADIYQVETKRLNEQVKRNLDRFPEDFRFQLSHMEWVESTSNSVIRLRSQNATLDNARGKHRKYLPFVFTEQGVAVLSGVLKSEAASSVHVAIMRAFASMRQMIHGNPLIHSRLDRVERKQLETDRKFEQIFKALERKDVIPNQGIFFDGQVFDAYELTSKIIRSATQSIVLIDNYIDETTITQLSKKHRGVNVMLLTQKISPSLDLDVQKANKQHGGFEL